MGRSIAAGCSLPAAGPLPAPPDRPNTPRTEAECGPGGQVSGAYPRLTPAVVARPLDLANLVDLVFSVLRGFLLEGLKKLNQLN